jgi:hypothetical protein
LRASPFAFGYEAILVFIPPALAFVHPFMPALAI